MNNIPIRNSKYKQNHQQKPHQHQHQRYSEVNQSSFQRMLPCYEYKMPLTFISFWKFTNAFRAQKVRNQHQIILFSNTHHLRTVELSEVNENTSSVGAQPGDLMAAAVAASSTPAAGQTRWAPSCPENCQGDPDWTTAHLFIILRKTFRLIILPSALKSLLGDVFGFKAPNSTVSQSESAASSRLSSSSSSRVAASLMVDWHFTKYSHRFKGVNSYWRNLNRIKPC